MKEYAKKMILRVAGGLVSEAEDAIAEEKRLKISVNGKEAVSLYCTPTMIRELVAGMLLTEGIIKGEICATMINIVYGEEISADVQAEAVLPERSRIITSGCAGGVTTAGKQPSGKITDAFFLSAESLRNIFNEFQRRSALYRLTGCAHSAALSDGKDIIAFAEDIGRHNAVDKVIGYSLLEGIRFEGKAMLASGRLSSEMVSKCSRWGIPVVASRAAPTNLAVEIAEARGITLIGFVRGERFNVYTHPRRIIQKS